MTQTDQAYPGPPYAPHLLNFGNCAFDVRDVLAVWIPDHPRVTDDYRVIVHFRVKGSTNIPFFIPCTSLDETQQVYTRVITAMQAYSVSAR